MKAKEILKALQISRRTLFCWHHNGTIRATKLSNGHYDFNPEDVYALINHGRPRGIYLYGRVSTYKQKADL